MELKAFILLAIPCIISAWNKNMENPNLYGGDMVMTPEQYAALVNGTKIYGSIINARWPNGVVPYVIHAYIDAVGRKAIQDAINDYHKYTCLKWVPRTNQIAYANFYPGVGCSSPVGYHGGRNDISLGVGCQYKGTAIHEMGHTIGLFHEQTRPDRDQYVTIYPSQIQQGAQGNFAIAKNIDSLGTPYDLESVMHYSSTAFATGPYYTITTKDPKKQHLIDHNDQYTGFSKIDIQQINLMYGCANVKPTEPTGGGCIDKHDLCPQWAKVGYCNSPNAEYLKNMKENCCKSCGGNFNPPTKSPIGCDDKNDQCVGWSKNGYCTATKIEHRNYMAESCCYSCKQPYAKCENTNKYCETWAHQNPSECSVNPNWMLKYCARACQVCN